MSINTFKQIIDALKSEQDEIVIEGNIADKVIKIKASGNVAWAIALAAIITGIAATFFALGSGGTATPATAVAYSMVAPAATASIGFSATSGAIGLALASGGVAIAKKLLTSLRKDYKVIASSKGKVVLKRIK